ncbi:hypothetical protein ONZ45_g754 [Pleurotus djamor]|nr:hypothetical protein ONZ45_g754 [Pleurotus djamor]
MPGFAPLLSTKRPAPKDSAIAPPAKRVAVEDEQYWTVQWRKPQQRKHKTWDGDGVLTIIGTTATLYDSDGKRLGGGKVEPGVESGSDMELAGKEISLDCPLSRDDYVSGTCFGRPALGAPVTIPLQPSSRTKKFVQPTFNIPKPRPILQPAPSTENHADPSPGISSSDSHWTANWRKVKTSSKKQTWDGDAYVSLSGSKLTMMSEDGKPMGSMTWNGAPLYSGLSFFIGSKQVEIDARVSASQLPSCTSTGDSPTITSNEPIDPPSIIEAPAPSSKFIVPSTNFYGSAPKPKGPRHDPNAANAIVMKSPTKEHESLFNARKHPVVPVVIDPILSRHLRPHQIEGVKFLYECVMGMRKHEGQGCILADEMGLGKTLQTISLVWTLLKQNPYGNGQPAIANAVIVCPVSLINNWKAEFHKWLGRDRVGVVACDKPDKKVIKTFVNTKTQQVLVIGYERLRTVIDELTSCFPPIGLIICDEGHRLKSAKNKTVETLKRFKTLRRIILSGTPIQNDLGEFHAMAEFCNPGLLDDYQTFRRIYEVPILKSRAPDATAKEIEMGTGRSAQLSTVAKSFVLRRDATILNNYLPPKYEYVVFVTPTSLQASMFQKILNPDRLDRLIQGPTAESLALINTLTKVSSSPILLKAAADKATVSGTTSTNAGLEAALGLLPSSAEVADVSLSGRFSMF